MFLYLKGLPNCGPSKLAVKKKSCHFGFEATFFAILCSNRRGPGSIPGRGGLQRRIVPLWKPLTHTILGLEAQERGSTFRVRHALLKTAILLSSY